MKNNNKKKINTYCVGFEDYTGNEIKDATKVAKFFNTNHTNLLITKKMFLEGIDKQVYFTDEPLADLTSIPLFFLFKK